MDIHWIFQSQDPALRKFRHGAWRLGGLVDRMKLHPTTEEARVVLAATRLQLAEQLAEIKDSPFLAAYKPDQVRRLLKGDWRIGWSWAEEAARAGFNEKYFRNVYSHFCDYAHCSYISSLQMEQVNTLAAHRMLGVAPLQTCVHVIARAIAFYQELFPGSQATVGAAAEKARKVACYWSFTGSYIDHLFEDSSQSEE